MAELKTKANDMGVDGFISGLDDVQQQADARQLVQIFEEITGQPAIMWGNAIIGFGSVDITYASGREVNWMQVGFSPRKGKITLYVTFDAADLTSRFPDLGKYKIAKGCIYIKRLTDVNVEELKKLITLAHKTGYQPPKRTDGKEQPAP